MPCTHPEHCKPNPPLCFQWSILYFLPGEYLYLCGVAVFISAFTMITAAPSFPSKFYFFLFSFVIEKIEEVVLIKGFHLAPAVHHLTFSPNSYVDVGSSLPTGGSGVRASGRGLMNRIVTLSKRPRKTLPF